MRPLNRPMFRYGGPIKEGVMSGIREPKKTGGSMGNLVGSPAYPKTNGREHHAVVSGTIAAGLGLNALRHGAMRYGARYLPRILQGVKRMFGKTAPGKTKNIYTGYSEYGPATYRTVTEPGKFTPNWLGRDPVVQGLNWGRKAIFNPTTGGWAAKGLRMAVSPTPLIAGGLYYANGRWFNKKGEVVPPPRSTGGNTVGPQHPSNNPDLYGGLKTAEDAAKAKLAAEKLRKDKIQKYRDIVDIKGMNREAAAKSLIEASRLINESQDFKGDIRSGKLINRIIQGTSKAYDKPADMKRAIDTLILKSELDKDVKASDPSNAQLNALRVMQGKKLQRELNPSFDNLKAAFAKDNKGQSGIELAAGAYSKNNDQIFRGPLITKKDFKKILSDLKKDPNTKDVDEVSIIKTWTQGELDSSQKNIPDGNYTVGDKIVTIKDKQVVDVN